MPPPTIVWLSLTTQSSRVRMPALLIPPPSPAVLPAVKLPLRIVTPRTATFAVVATNMTGANAKVPPGGWLASMMVVSAPCPASVSVPTGQSAGVVNKAPRLLPRKKHGVACDSTYVPAGTLIVTGSVRPLALMIAPRRLQSFGVASSQATRLGSSAVVSTLKTAARAGIAPRAAARPKANNRRSFDHVIGIPLPSAAIRRQSLAAATFVLRSQRIRAGLGRSGWLRTRTRPGFRRLWPAPIRRLNRASPSNSALARDRECLVHDVSLELL